MSLRTILSEHWFAIQQELFPALKEEIGPLGQRCLNSLPVFPGPPQTATGCARIRIPIAAH